MNTNRCDYAKKCGGCRFINESYQKSLEYKQDYICKLLKQFGRIEDIIGMEQPYFYRNKAVKATLYNYILWLEIYIFLYVVRCVFLPLSSKKSFAFWVFLCYYS